MQSQVSKTTVQILNSQFTVRINSDDVTINYDHTHTEMTIWINDVLTLKAIYNPQRMMFNYVNIVEIAAKYWTRYYQLQKKGMNWNSRYDCEDSETPTDKQKSS